MFRCSEAGASGRRSTLSLDKGGSEDELRNIHQHLNDKKRLTAHSTSVALVVPLKQYSLEATSSFIFV